MGASLTCCKGQRSDIRRRAALCGIVAVFDGSVLFPFPAPTLRKEANRNFFYPILQHHKEGDVLGQ